MAILSLTVLPAKALKDGKNKVRIAVAHNSQTRYIVTDVILNSTKEWKNGRIVRRDDATYLNTKLLQRLQEVQRIIDDTPYVEGMTCPELVETITQTKAKKSHTLETAFNEMLEVSNAKRSTKDNYRHTFSSITRYLPKSTRVTRITPLMLNRYVKSRTGNLRGVTIRYHIALITQILNYCQVNGYTEFRVLPTNGIVKSAPAIRQNWLSPDEIREVRDLNCKTKIHCRYRDLFMLSYYLGGINIIDLAKINFDQCGDRLKYVRTKTDRTAKINPYVEFDIPDEAKAIIERYKGSDGRIRVSGATKIEDHSSCVTNMFVRMRTYYGWPEMMTFYSARKSFAQHAFMLGVSESVIDYVLGHSLGSRGGKMLYSYIKVTPEMATACVRKVCDFIASNKNFS